MTNNYDAHDANDLDAREQLNQAAYGPPLNPAQIAAKGQLNLALRTAVQEAQHLANYYDSVAKQLSLLASQVEHTK